MKLRISLGDGRLSILSEGFNKYEARGFLFFYAENNIKPEANIVKFAKINKGIVVQEEALVVRILNDPFRSVPLYITQMKQGDIIVFSNFEDCFGFSGFEPEYDRIGFWETILYGGGIGTRTILRNVKQMIAASKVIIDKKTNTYTISRYWDFDIFEDTTIGSIEEAGRGLYNRLTDIFSTLTTSAFYLLGMSGGVDSRITLAFLSRHVKKDRIRLYTYGYDERILEYSYAKMVAANLNVALPEFHILKADAYEKALRTINLESGGQIGIGHCHTYDYLAKNADRLKEQLHISTMYSDAILGWEAVYPKRNENIKDSSYFKVPPVPLTKDIWDEIENDVSELFKPYHPEYNFSSIDEFKYVTERNAKFHMYLAFLHRKYVNTLTPFADFDLLTYMISMPAQFRHQKRLSDYVLERYFPEISLDNIGNISSRCWWGPKFAGYFAFIEKGLINRLNTLLFRISGGRHQIFDKYMTETWRQVLYTHLNEALDEALRTLFECEIIDSKQRQYFYKPAISFSGVGIGERFQIIGLAELIKSTMLQPPKTEECESL